MRAYPVVRLIVSNLLEPGRQDRQLRDGRKERGETNPHDKATSMGLTPLVRAVSCTKKRKGKKRGEPEE